MTNANRAAKPTTRNTAATPKDDSRRVLGTFTPKGTDGEQRKCSGVCGLRLPVRKFPTSKLPGVRVAECRSCRDSRTKAATKTKGAK